jgi:membrane fusion protein, heavy metal efflux system
MTPPYPPSRANRQPLPVGRRLAGAGPRAVALAWLPALVLWPGPGGAQVPPPAGSVGRTLDCMIQPSQLVQMGSPAPGVIERILVDRGDMVKQGQPLVQLNASVERASLALARERAGQHGEVSATDGARELAERELARADELYRKNFVSGTYRDKQRAEAKVATGRSAEAQEKRKLADRELELATAQLSQRTLRAPISGVVIERYLALGEFVDQKPVLRIAAIDPLRVDVLVPAASFGQVNVGATAKVTPELVNRRALVATVTTVDRVIDAASNTFRVRLELPNPGGVLPAGLRCRVELGLPLVGPQMDAARVAPSPARPVQPVAGRSTLESATSAAAAMPAPRP